MKKAILLTAIVINILVVSLFSETVNLNSFINLDISLKELSRSEPEFLDSIISSEKYIIVEGTISSITDIERSENNLILDIHIINGEWIGLEKVEVYKCIINVSGLFWEKRFPQRKPRELTDELLEVNDQIMVIGKVQDYVLDNSSLTAVVNAEHIRKIQ